MPPAGRCSEHQNVAGHAGRVDSSRREKPVVVVAKSVSGTHFDVMVLFYILGNLVDRVAGATQETRCSLFQTT